MGKRKPDVEGSPSKQPLLDGVGRDDLVSSAKSKAKELGSAAAASGSKAAVEMGTKALGNAAGKGAAMASKGRCRMHGVCIMLLSDVW